MPSTDDGPVGGTDRSRALSASADSAGGDGAEAGGADHQEEERDRWSVAGDALLERREPAAPGGPAETVTAVIVSGRATVAMVVVAVAIPGLALTRRGGRRGRGRRGRALIVVVVVVVRYRRRRGCCSSVVRVEAGMLRAVAFAAVSVSTAVGLTVVLAAIFTRALPGRGRGGGRGDRRRGCARGRGRTG